MDSVHLQYPAVLYIMAIASMRVDFPLARIKKKPITVMYCYLGAVLAIIAEHLDQINRSTVTFQDHSDAI